MEQNNYYDERLYLDGIKTLRLIIWCIVIAISLCLLRVHPMAALVALIIGAIIGSGIFTYQYKRRITASISGNLEKLPSFSPQLEKYDLVRGSTYDYEDALQTSAEGRRIICADMVTYTSDGKHNHRYFTGNCYQCQLPVDTANTIFAFSPKWNHKRHGEVAISACGIDFRTQNGKISDSLKQIITRSIAPMINKMSLREHAVVIDQDQLYIIEDDETDYFDAHLFSNLNRRTHEDIQHVGDIRLNINLLKSIGDSLADDDNKQQTAETKYGNYMAEEYSSLNFSGNFCKESIEAEARDTAGKLGNLKHLQIWIAAATLLIWAATLIPILTMGPKGNNGFLFVLTALIPLTVATIILPFRVFHSIVVSRTARAVFGEGVTTSTSKKQSTITTHGATITSFLGKGTVSSSVEIPGVFDIEVLRDKAIDIMGQFSKYATVDIRSHNDTLTIEANNIGIACNTDTSTSDNQILSNVRGLIYMREVIMSKR